MEKSRKTKSWEELTFADNYLFCKILEVEIIADCCSLPLEEAFAIKEELTREVVAN